MGILMDSSDADFLAVVEQSACLSDVVRAFGLSPTGSTNLRHAKERMALLGCTFGKTMHHRGGAVTHDLQDILVQNSKYESTRTLKNRLVTAGLLEYKCAVCGNDGLWNGKPLVLTLDHINGDKHDNRIDNLRLLCPNCDSQSDTFKGRNIKFRPAYSGDSVEWKCKVCGKSITKGYDMCIDCARHASRVVERPSKDALCDMIQSMSFTDIGRKYGVSDNAVRRWCKSYGLPFRKNDL